MKYIKSKFKSKCASCNKEIPKGINIAYDPKTKKAYHMECDPSSNDDHENIPDPGEMYFDNWCATHNI